MFGVDSQNFEVLFEAFAERHFVKQFRKKYRNQWTVTEKAIVALLMRVDNLIGKTTQIEVIHARCEHRIAKLDFRVVGTSESAKCSGNRAIVYINMNTRQCRVMIVYSKNDICSPRETQKCEMMVRENLPDVWGITIK